jgi:DNA-binding transcriptional regulator YdaS (Cro superfamily)
MKNKFTAEQMIELLGGAKKVAMKTNVTVQAVYQWRNSTIPADKLMMLAALLEKESHGLITRQEMFPECWHWIWPELVPKSNTFLERI